MDCPACGTGGAYVGITTIECINSACAHYAPSQGTLWNDPLIEKWKPSIQKLKVVPESQWGLVARELEEEYSKFPVGSSAGSAAVYKKIDEIKERWGGKKSP